MALRYWVGGTGTWNDTNTANWSTSSGGASGASVPTAADDVVFDSASNGIAYTVTFGSSTLSGSGSVTSGSAVLTVTAVTLGTISVGQIINGYNIIAGSKIASFGTGTGGAGTYNLDTVQTATSGTVAINSGSPIMRDLTVAGPAIGNVTFNGTSNPVFGGNFTLPATGLTWSFTSSNGIFAPANQTLTNTITTNGVSITGIGMGISQGIWVLGSALTIGAGLSLQSGSFNTNNFALTVVSFTTTTVVAKTLSFGSSTITCTGTPFNIVNSLLTFNAGTSTIILSSATNVFGSNTNGLTYYNVSFTGTAQGTRTLTGTMTFNNLSFSGLTAVGLSVISVNANLTVTGTLTVSAPTTTGTSRYNIASATIGTVVTITAGAVSLTDVDFSDITGAGAASWTGTRLGDAAGNSNITFPAAKTSYFVGTTSANWSTSQWAASSGGATASTNFPLPQDTATIDNSSLTAGNVLTINSVYNVGTLTCAARSTAMTLATSTAVNIFGDYILSSSITISGTNAIQFRNRSSSTITTANVSITNPITVYTVTGTVFLGNSLTALSSFTLTSGNINLNGFDLTCFQFSSSNSNTRSIIFGSNAINVTGTAATIWLFGTATNFTYTGSGTVNCTYSGAGGTRTLSHGGVAGGTATNSLNFNITAGTDTVAFGATGTFYCNNVNFTGFSGILTSITVAIYGNLTFSATQTIPASAISWNFSATSGTKTITTNNVTIGFNPLFNSASGSWQFQDNFTTAATQNITLQAGTLDFNAKTVTTGFLNSNYATARTLLATGSTVNLTGSAGTIFNFTPTTNLSMTGAMTVNCTYSGAVGTRTFAQGSFPATTNATTLNVTAGSDAFVISSFGTAQDMSFAGYTGALTLPAALSMYGNLTLGTTMTIAANSGSLSFIGTGTKTITTNAVPVNINLVLNSSGIRAFQDAVTMGATNTITVNGGTVNFKNATTNTASAFVFSGSPSQITVGSTTAAATYTLSQTTGTVSATNMSIQDSIATGGATWLAYANQGNIDLGNNTGWTFGNAPGYGINFQMSLRSFTETRRF